MVISLKKILMDVVNNFYSLFFVTVTVTLINTVFLSFRCGTWLIAS